MNMMAWLRPDITTSAAIYGMDGRSQAIIFMKLFLHGWLTTYSSDSQAPKAPSITSTLTLNDSTCALPTSRNALSN